ncbi:hypothetical protein Naga_100963g1, partial [Nannochloropsis gaditana]
LLLLLRFLRPPLSPARARRHQGQHRYGPVAFKHGDGRAELIPEVGRLAPPGPRLCAPWSPCPLLCSPPCHRPGGSGILPAGGRTDGSGRAGRCRGGQGGRRRSLSLPSSPAGGAGGPPSTAGISVQTTAFHPGTIAAAGGYARNIGMRRGWGKGEDEDVSAMGMEGRRPAPGAERTLCCRQKSRYKRGTETRMQVFVGEARF